MATQMRKIIRIDEDKCNGCGDCIPNCVEGALEIVDGKAKLVSDKYCDGLGACLGHCPQDAITIEERSADAFDEHATAVHVAMAAKTAVKERLVDIEPMPAAVQAHSHSGGCPGSRTMDFRDSQEISNSGTDHPSVPSQLRQWPVKLKLVNPAAGYFANVHLLLAADCAPFACADFHQSFLKDKSLIIVCPKFEEMPANLQKLTAICAANDILSITVAHMEVPCCFGLAHLAQAAVQQSGKEIPVTVKIVGIRGDVG